MKYLKKIASASEAVAQEYDVVYSIEGGGVVVKSATPQIEAVDLGLPSGLKWMKCNIGASTETEYGKYFQWGDTVGYEGDEAKAHSTWSTAPFNNGSSDYNESYFASVSGTVCPNGVLALEYDAVHQATNGAAHMPTVDQIKELTANTTATWYAKGNTEFNGVAGRKFASKTDPSKYIFIPVAGCCFSSSFLLVGSSGYVWSSSLGTSGPYDACYLSFNSGGIGSYGLNRVRGFSVRGVLY